MTSARDTAEQAIASRRKRLLTLLTTSAALTSAGLAPAIAENASTRRAVIVRGSPTSGSIRFDISAQPLAGALSAFGRQSGLQVTLDASTSQGLSAPAVVGMFTPRDALRRLLAGTGVSFRLTPDRTAVIARASDQYAADDAVPLDPIDVGAEKTESAYGPVRGYVARRSATATKTDTPLHETPQSITVIGREQLDDRNVRTVNDAIHYTAGVATYYSNDTRNDAFNIRGFSADFFYLDGTRLPGVSGRGLDQWRVDPYQLERIEVLKGPSSVMYGLGDVGGVLSMVSKMPTEHARSQIDFLAGSYSHIHAGVDTSGPLDEDGRWLYRAIALARTKSTPFTEPERCSRRL